MTITTIKHSTSLYIRQIYCLFTCLFLMIGSPGVSKAHNMTTKKCKAFSVRIPDNWAVEIKEKSGVYSSVTSSNHYSNQSIIIGAYYINKNPADFLKEQIGGTTGSPFLRNADPRSISTFTFGKISGKKIHISGVVGGDSFNGDVYAFKFEGYLFNVINIGETHAYTQISEVINSISINSSFNQTSSSTEELIEGTVQTLKSRTPYEYSRGLTTTDVRIDKFNKTLHFVLQVEVPYDSYTPYKKEEIISVLKEVQRDQQTLLRNGSDGFPTLYKSALDIGYKIHFRYISRRGNVIYEYDIKN